MKRFNLTSSFLLLIFCLVQPLHAGEIEERQKIEALETYSKALRAKAENDFALREPECYASFLVNRCLDEAKTAKLTKIRQARELAYQASRMRLAIKQRNAAAKGILVAPDTDLAAPMADPEPDFALIEQANRIREERERQLRQAEAAAASAQAQKDELKKQRRAEAEAEAAERAKAAAQDKQRYDERLKQHLKNQDDSQLQ